MPVDIYALLTCAEETGSQQQSGAGADKAKTAIDYDFLIKIF